MIYRQQELKFTKKQQTATIGITSCWHVGNPQCREDKITEMLNRWKSKKTPWINLGDTVEGITALDPRFHCETHQASICMQIAQAADLAKIARNQMIGSIIGNHEDKLSKYFGCATRDFLSRVYKDKSQAEYRWLGAAARIDFQCPDGVCKGFFAHSRLSYNSMEPNEERRLANAAIKLRNNLRPFEGDLKIVGHGHKSIITKPVPKKQLSIVNGKEKMVDNNLYPEWCAMCPSMFASYDNQGYPSYGELAMFPPQDVGYLEADIRRDGTVKEVRAL